MGLLTADQACRLLDLLPDGLPTCRAADSGRLDACSVLFKPFAMGPNEVEDAAPQFNSRVQIVSPLPDHFLNRSPLARGCRAKRHKSILLLSLSTIQTGQLNLPSRRRASLQRRSAAIIARTREGADSRTIFSLRGRLQIQEHGEPSNARWTPCALEACPAVHAWSIATAT
jgi:hypothetical protein